MLAPAYPRVLALTILLLLPLSLPPPALSQVTYEYDALGRLIVVGTPEGVAIYEYDAVGNILRITTRRHPDVSGPVAILGVNPTKGAPGTAVTLYGRGFGATPAENQVAFNTVAAPVTAVSGGTLITIVPPGATTGPITLTAPQGSGTSPEPFTVFQAFAVVPDQADVALGGTVDFQATLSGSPTAEVTWRVNGIAGGNAAVGTITTAGTYTAPGAPPPVQPVPVEAVLMADPTQIVRASVRVVGQVSGLGAAAPVSVAVTPASGPAASRPVSVSRAPESPPVMSGPMSVTGGPLISAVSPSAAPPGATGLVVTIAGGNLQDASLVRFLWNGSLDSALSATAVLPAEDGASASFTLTIAAGAAQGRRVVQVVTPHGTSSSFDLGTNGFTVQP